MNILKKAFPFIFIVIGQLMILALLNLSFNPQYKFPEGNIGNYIGSVNLLIVILLISSILTIGKTINNIEHEVENQIRVENLGYLNDLILTMRGQRHDLNNHLQTIYGFLSVEAYEEAKSYLNEYISKISVINQIIMSDNTGINAMLYVKSGQMERHGINLEVDIRTSLQLPIKTIELNIVIGNLLDNAMQKLVNMPVDKPKIVLKSYRNGETAIITVTDNGQAIDPLIIGKIFDPGFSTKYGNEGMGLFTIRKELSKYNGIIEVSSKEGLTIFAITLPLKKDML